jgi:hypothetical protein
MAHGLASGSVHDAGHRATPSNSAIAPDDAIYRWDAASAKKWVNDYFTQFNPQH